MVHLGSVMIAGLWHHVEAKWVAAHVEEGLAVRMTREPNNPHDSQAITLHLRDNVSKTHTLLGYVPAAQNACFAALMDAGFVLVGQVTDVEARKGVVAVDIAISEKRGRLALLKHAQKIVQIVREQESDDAELTEAINDYAAVSSK